MNWLIVSAVAAFLWLTVRAVNSVRYELRDDALCIAYGPWCVRRIPYSNIESVQRGTAFFNEHFTRLSPDPNITLRLRRGIVAPNLVINPPHTDEFIERLNAKLMDFNPASNTGHA